MKICLKIAICLVLISFCSEAPAQQSRYSGDVEAPVRYRSNINRNQRPYRDLQIRVARQTVEQNSVLNSSQFYNAPSRIPLAESLAPAARVPVQNQPVPEASFYNSGFANGGFSNGYPVTEQDGYYPYVTGDIFGLSREGICDEWFGLLPCLELTNSRSNCECTNSRRAHWGLSDSIHDVSGGCNSCSGGGGGYGYEPGYACLLYTSPSPRDRQKSRMPSSA